MTDTDGDDVETLLSFVADRFCTLRVLRTSDRVALTTLAERTDTSKSTANRTANELADAGLLEVHEAGGQHEYSLTFFGRQVADWVEEGRDLLLRRRMYAPLPREATLPRWVVDGGSVDIVGASDPAKHEVFDQIIEFISRVDRFHVVAPALTRDSTFSHLAENVLTEGTAVEMTLPESFLSMLASRFSEEMDEMLTDHEVSAYALPEDVTVPYGFGLGYHEEDGTVVDGEVAVVCYDEYRHSATGTVVNDTPEAVAWVERRYESYRDRATEWTDHHGEPVES